MPRTAASTRSTDDEAPERAFPTLREPRYSQSLERGLAILGCYTPGIPVLGIADIADRVGMSRSTTHRYAITLVALGFLHQVDDRRYRLGVRAGDLGMAAMKATPLSNHAHPDMDELFQHTRFTVNVGMLDGPDVRIVARRRSTRRHQYLIDQDMGLGTRLPFQFSGMGKLLVAYLDDEALREELICGAVLEPSPGPRSVESTAALATELHQIRRQGSQLVKENEERAPRLIGVAAPIRSEGGEVIGAISLEAHTSMIGMKKLAAELGHQVLATADHISARLDYRRDDEQAALT